MTDVADLQAQERVGTVLNEKWTLERLIGVGGMAAVYAARHRNGARAAVKVLHRDLSRHKEVRERFQREGYASNRVEHPGAVKVLDDDVIATGPDAGTAYLVMELLEGESLQDRLERGPPMKEREFLGIAEMVLDVLDAAHTRGVVHRDLKPENLFLVRDAASGLPRVKVVDFGLARLLDGQTITSYGLALGTPSFMSPEQAAGRIDEIDGRTDLFALAATGFRLRTGRRIHEGANPIELVRKMASFAAPKIQTMGTDVSDAFARVIDRALEFRREDRYESAAAMRDDVRRAKAELDGFARTELAIAPPMSSQTPPDGPPPSVHAPLPPPTPSPRRSAVGEPTMEVSESDIETSPPPPARPPSRPPSRSDELPILRSARPPRSRRSILPWVALVLFAGIGTKLWLDTQRPTAARAPAPAASEATVPSASVAAVPPPSPSSSTSAAPPASSAAPAPSAAPPPPATPPPAPAVRRTTPARPGPGTVHHLVAPHRRGHGATVKPRQ